MLDVATQREYYSTCLGGARRRGRKRSIGPFFSFLPAEGLMGLEATYTQNTLSFTSSSRPQPASSPKILLFLLPSLSFNHLPPDVSLSRLCPLLEALRIAAQRSLVTTD